MTKILRNLKQYTSIIAIAAFLAVGCGGEKLTSEKVVSELKSSSLTFTDTNEEQAKISGKIMLDSPASLNKLVAKWVVYWSDAASDRGKTTKVCETATITDGVLCEITDEAMKGEYFIAFAADKDGNEFYTDLYAAIQDKEPEKTVDVCEAFKTCESCSDEALKDCEQCKACEETKMDPCYAYENCDSCKNDAVKGCELCDTCPATTVVGNACDAFVSCAASCSDDALKDCEQCKACPTTETDVIIDNTCEAFVSCEISCSEDDLKGCDQCKTCDNNTNINVDNTNIEPEVEKPDQVDLVPVTILLDDILYDFDKAELTEEYMNFLDDEFEIATGKDKMTFVIAGHADERGSNEYNLALGERRAYAVKRYLISLGFYEENIRIISYGEEKPVDTGHNESAWSKNRRAATEVTE